MTGFNPRTHEGCDYMESFERFAPDGFNPRTHEGCDSAESYDTDDDEVSIHAPTRGATQPRQRPTPMEGVSIHAPTRGATKHCADDLRQVHVSIHAPTRGATKNPDNNKRHNNSFNPRTHEGCDTTTDSVISKDLVFQSTHPRGVRPRIVYFQGHERHVSIHAPTRGATNTTKSTAGNPWVSIHAPTRGATFICPL